MQLSGWCNIMFSHHYHLYHICILINYIIWVAKWQKCSIINGVYCVLNGVRTCKVQRRTGHVRSCYVSNCHRGITWAKNPTHFFFTYCFSVDFLGQSFGINKKPLFPSKWMTQGKNGWEIISLFFSITENSHLPQPFFVSFFPKQIRKPRLKTSWVCKICPLVR